MQVLRVAASFGALSLFLLAAGCEQKPSIPPPPSGGQAAKNVAPSSQPSAEEMKNLNAFARNEAQSMVQQSAEAPALPAGHPPVPGMSTPAEPAGSEKSALPSGHPPIDGSPVTPPIPPPGGDLIYAVPPTWQAGKPSSGMRKAQWVLPRAEGDDRDGEMVLFYFGPGQGGDVAGNITRWRGMFSTSEGKPIDDAATRQETIDSNGLKITLLEFSGKYSPSMMPGAPSNTAIPDARMLAAIVEGPGGPWFFRGVGPEATMVAHREGFIEMIRSAKP